MNRRELRGGHCRKNEDKNQFHREVIVAGKQPALQYLDMDAAIKHCTAGIGIWEWASNDKRTARRYGVLRLRPDFGKAGGEPAAHPCSLS